MAKRKAHVKGHYRKIKGRKHWVRPHYKAFTISFSVKPRKKFRPGMQIKAGRKGVRVDAGL